MSIKESAPGNATKTDVKKKMGGMPFAFSCVVVVSAFAIGIQFSYLALRAIQIQYAVKEWPTADAVIESGETVSSKGSSGSAVRWSAEWDYNYTIGGIKYRSKSTSVKYGYAAKWETAKEAAQEDLAKRPAGSGVTVHYNPDDPSRSVIDIREPGLLEFLPALVSLLGFAVGGFLFVWLRRELKKNQEQ